MSNNTQRTTFAIIVFFFTRYNDAVTAAQNELPEGTSEETSALVYENLKKVYHEQSGNQSDEDWYLFLIDVILSAHLIGSDNVFKPAMGLMGRAVAGGRAINDDYLLGNVDVALLEEKHEALFTKMENAAMNMSLETLMKALRR